MTGEQMTTDELRERILMIIRQRLSAREQMVRLLEGFDHTDETLRLHKALVQELQSIIRIVEGAQ